MNWKHFVLRWFVLAVVTAHKGLTDLSRLEPATPLLVVLEIISPEL